MISLKTRSVKCTGENVKKMNDISQCGYRYEDARILFCNTWNSLDSREE
jgi:hypothetical protein